MTLRRILVIACALLAVVPLAACSVQAPDDAGPTFAPQAADPPSVPWTGGPAYTVIVDPSWAADTAEATGIPLTAVIAYAEGAIASENVRPGCGIGWNTLAGIGLVESDHGRHGGSVVDADGRADPPIFGVVLDGSETAHIPDSDGGALDGISDYDRAMGPMQMLPQTWNSWNIDASGDNVADPQNIRDAAFAAANYLCHASDDMTTPDGWRQGIAAYNAGEDYLIAVATAAQRYGAAD